MNSNHKSTAIMPYDYAGLFTLSLRLVVGWTYFSAFWRRLFLADKLNPELANYIGIKFNHFLPQALGIKPLIEYLVTHPDSLQFAMVSFTIIEGIVGLFIIFGLYSRLMSVGVFGLALGILLGSGWLGTTCLDEWQIGILGIASGFVLFLSGGGAYSLDHKWNLNAKFKDRKWIKFLTSEELPIPFNQLKRITLLGSIIILILTLYTNQYFHGGLWGELHNKSIKPKVEISNVQLSKKALSFQIYRVEGVDVYGSFLIGIELINELGKSMIALDGEDLAQFPKQDIDNKYIASVHSGSHSLVIPLGAKAILKIKNTQLNSLEAGRYQLILTDISGAHWISNIEYK